MRVHSLRFSYAAVAVLAFLSFSSPPVFAGKYLIRPMILILAREQKSDLLTLQNRGDTPMSMELSAFSWDQGAGGEQKLAASDDLIFFPSVFSLQPGEVQLVRVGSTVPPGLTEKNYRILLRELPPTTGAPSPKTGVRPSLTVTTSTYVSVFILPSTLVGGESISGLEMKNGQVSFQVKNDGDVHLGATGLVIKGLGASGKEVFQQDPQGGFVLAQESRQYRFQVPDAQCRDIESVVVEYQFERPSGLVSLDHGTLKAQAAVAAGACKSPTASAKPGTSNPLKGKGR